MKQGEQDNLGQPLMTGVSVDGEAALESTTTTTRTVTKESTNNWAWLDTLRQAATSPAYCGLALPISVIVMLALTYSTKTPSPALLNSCPTADQTCLAIAAAAVAMTHAFNGLRLAVLGLSAIPVAIPMITAYLDQLHLLFSSKIKGTISGIFKGLCVVALGFGVISYLALRTYNCASSLNSGFAICAKAGDPTARQLNDALITGAVLLASTALMWTVRKVLDLKAEGKSIRTEISRTYTTVANRDFVRQCAGTVNNFFVCNMQWHDKPPAYNPAAAPSAPTL